MGIWEDLGFTINDPEINERIRQYFARQRSESSLENSLSPSVIRRAREIVNLRNPYNEHISEQEMLVRLRELRSIGYPVGPYSNMNSARLYSYFSRLRSQVLEQAEKVDAS